MLWKNQTGARNDPNLLWKRDGAYKNLFLIGLRGKKKKQKKRITSQKGEILSK